MSRLYDHAQKERHEVGQGAAVGHGPQGGAVRDVRQEGARVGHAFGPPALAGSTNRLPPLPSIARLRKRPELSSL